MTHQIIDIIEPGIPGATGDVTPAAIAARDAAVTARNEARDARDQAKTWRDQAETFAADTVALQDEAIAQAISTPGSETQTQLNATIAEATSTLVTGQPNHLTSILERGQADAALVLIGDSTGNEPSEWFYLTVVWLGQQFPTHTILYRLWNDGAQSYDAATTVQTGTGPRTLTVYNGSVPGIGHDYPIATIERLSALVPAASNTVIVSLGYNSNQDNYRAPILEVSRRVLGLRPAVEFVAVVQPPKAGTDSDYANQAKRTADVRAVASSEGWGIIDAARAFLNYGDYAADLPDVDGIHPNAVGSQVWSDVAKQYFRADNPTPTPRLPSPSVDRIWVPAQAFTKYAGAVPEITFPPGIIVPKWDFGPDENGMIAGIVDIPPAWLSVNVDFLWSSPADATGAVVWQLDHFTVTPEMIPTSGGGLGGATVGTPVTVSTVNTTAFRVTRMHTQQRYAGGRPVAFRPRREGTASEDTSPGTAWLYGLIITRAE